MIDKNKEHEYIEFMSLFDVAEYLGISLTTVRRYLTRYKRPLPHMRISSKKILIKKTDLDNWLEDARKVDYE